jgi:hypothetical protein
VGIPGGSQTMFCEREKCPRFQNPVGFSEKLGAVGDVHGDVLSVGTVENTVWIWQTLAVSLFYAIR